MGMAAGAGLPLLAGLVTALHFVIVLGYTPLGRFISARGHAERGFTITYQDGRGVLRDLLAACTARSWTISSLFIIGSVPETRSADVGAAHNDEDRLVTIGLTLSGPGATEAAATVGAIPGSAASTSATTKTNSRHTRDPPAADREGGLFHRARRPLARGRRWCQGRKRAGAHRPAAHRQEDSQ